MKFILFSIPDAVSMFCRFLTWTLLAGLRWWRCYS